MTWKILRLFVNTLIGDDKYSLLNRGNLTQHIQKCLSQKQNNFFELFCAFFKYIIKFEHFRKKMTLKAYVSQKLWTSKGLLR